MRHATITLGEYTVPLLGIDPSATEESCDHCSEVFHIQQVRLVVGQFLCARCQIARVRAQVEASKHSGSYRDLPDSYS